MRHRSSPRAAFRAFPAFPARLCAARTPRASAAFRASIVAGALVAGAAGCTAQSGPPAAADPSGAPAASAPTATAAAAAASDSAATAPGASVAASGGASPGRGTPCGALGCKAFASATEAFAEVLAAKPLVLGIGESHAPKGLEGVPSTTKRFTEQLLPLLQGKASDLLVELMLPPKGCKQKTEQVKKKQEPVVQQQASTNQNEYVVLGEAARKLGVVPDALRPTCDHLDAIDKAGDDAIMTMLSTIASLTAEKTKQLLARKGRKPDEMVVAYGGAMHNDVEPRPGREPWSYAKELDAASGGRYVELDVFVPELIQPTDTWRALPWYPHYDPSSQGAKAVLFRPRPNAYVLILPRAGSQP